MGRVFRKDRMCLEAGEPGGESGETEGMAEPDENV